MCNCAGREGQIVSAQVHNLSGRPNMLDTGHILAANDALHPVLLKTLKAANRSPSP